MTEPLRPLDHEGQWLLELTRLPTAAGREQRVIDWIRGWAAARPAVRLAEDGAGNLILRAAHKGDAHASARPLYITAHLDHPAFVVERVIGPGTVLASFRGGVLDPYFRSARLRFFTAGVAELTGTVVEHTKKEPFPECLVELDAGEATDALAPGDIGRWDLPPASVEGDTLHTDACDDLAAVAAALGAFDRLLQRAAAPHLRLLFTRAEEVGFIGAIAACRLGTIEKDARVIALENSRSFPESPVGGGPIVRVGDRISVFHAQLTAAVGKVAERLATPAPGEGPALAWQRRLMPGGACEASVFQAYGLEATCVCLPLGNYHNMGALDRVQEGDESAAAPAREFISLSDYAGMIALLVGCAERLDDAEPLVNRMERLYAEKSFVLR